MEPERRTADHLLSATDGRRVCARCDEPMLDRQCKIVCPNCGAFHDCSDP